MPVVVEKDGNIGEVRGIASAEAELGLVSAFFGDEKGQTHYAPVRCTSNSVEM